MVQRYPLRCRRLLSLILWLAIVGRAASAQDPTGRAASIQRQVEAIAVGEGIEGRRAAILSRLEALGVEAEIHWFDLPPTVQVDRRGANITATIRGATPNLLLLGAHYDEFGRAQGVIDNAAGVAAVLELLEAFAREPLRHFTLGVAFFDLEEESLRGSRAMVSDSARSPLPAFYLNFDIFGYGNAFWIGTRNQFDPLPRLLSDVGTTRGLEVVIDSMYPSSDHASYRNTSTTSYAISLLDAADIHILLSRFRSGGRASGETPRIFRIMHTTEDTLDKLDAAAVARGVAAVEAALRRFDASQPQR